MYIIIVFIILFILMFLNIPIGISMAYAVFGGIVASDSIPFTALVQRLYNGMDSFVLIAIPLFMLCGQLMSLGGVTRDLLRLSQALVGRLRGGLAYVNIVVSMFFAGITGAASSDSASIGGILIPAMKEDGYEEDFSVAVTAASSTIGVMIPPSNPLVMYAAATSVSVGKLLMGGIIPGILVGLSLCGVVYVFARKRNYPTQEKLSLKETIQAIYKGIPACLTIVIMLGGIMGGFFTPTEAAGIAVLYSFLLGVFYYKELKLSQIPNIIRDVAITMGQVTLMVAAAQALGYLFALNQLPALLADAILSITTNKYLVLFFINLALLFVGMWMDIGPAVLIFAPILMPLTTSLGINPVHFGVVMVVNLAIGLFTPPVGQCLFISCSIAKISVTDTVKVILPFIMAAVVVLFLITYVPGLVMWLPNMMM